MVNFSTRDHQIMENVNTRHSATPLIPLMDKSNPPCNVDGERQCEDGSCIQAVDLCPEEQLMNQNTILIMIVVGLAVVIFLIVLYCFQQRQRETTGRRPGSEIDAIGRDEEDNASLYMPPPSYEEVVTTDLYPPTPQMRHTRERITSIEEPPMTPPPNYDTALIILARSHESVFGKLPTMRRKSSCVSRRSISVDNLNNRETTVPVTANVTTISEQEKDNKQVIS